MRRVTTILDYDCGWWTVRYSRGYLDIRTKLMGPPIPKDKIPELVDNLKAMISALEEIKNDETN